MAKATREQKPYQADIVVDLCKLDKVHIIDKDSKLVTVESGITIDKLQNTLLE